MSFISLLLLFFFSLIYCRTRWVIIVESQLPRTARESSDRGYMLVPHRALLYPFPDVPPLEKFNCEEAKGHRRESGGRLRCYLFFLLPSIRMTNVS